MKKKLTIKTSQSSRFIPSLLIALAGFAGACSLLFALLSCEQPFKAGLGPVIDLQDPTIVLEHPTAGAYIRKERDFTGRAADDYKLDSVWFNLANYPDVDLSEYSAEYKTMKVDDVLYHRITDTQDIKGDSRNITWKFTINTLLKKTIIEDGEEVEVRVFPDGDFKIRLRAVDSMGKYVVTDEIVFYIKNDIPDIVITAPPIQNGTEPGQLGGGWPEAKFNFGYIKDQANTSFRRVMDTNSDIFGRISDYEGIYRGEWNPAYHTVDEDGNLVFNEKGEPVTIELFPPQIRFWQVYFGDALPVDKNGITITNAYKPDVLPSLSEVPWQNLVEGERLTVIDDKNLGLEYRLGDDSGFFYAFQVRAQSKDSVHSSAEYPRDYINFEGAAQDKDFINENSYVLILVREPLEYPAIGLYRFEDIKGQVWKREGETMTYPDLSKPEEPDKLDGNHEYIDKPIVNKKGPFTLRVKTSHGGGIASAKVYWEKSDKSEKGRFIWDPVDRWYPSWIGAIPSKARHYSEWGFNEPDGQSRVRSFVFTYTDTGNDKLDSTTTEFSKNIMGNIQGMSKIQRYTTDADKQYDPITKKRYEFDELPDDIFENGESKNKLWSPVSKLEEGTYNLYIYATSMSGTRVPTPYNVTLYIDRVGPTILLNYIEGSAKDVTNEKTLEREITVNGVIQPRFLFSDSRPVDTSIRTATSEYFRIPPDPNNPSAAGGFYTERAYILIPEAEKTLMNSYLVEHPWPEFPNVRGGAPVLKTSGGQQVTVSKHGPIMLESSARFKTSPIYYNANNMPDYQNEKDSLPDGDYRMYVFARDNAFNVNKVVSFPILVRYKSDIPKFDFSISDIYTTAVTEPDSSYDYKGANYKANEEKSFITATGKRGIFTANSSIQVRITDDDSLALGVRDDPGHQSGITVTFTGSKVEKVNGKDTVVAKSGEGYMLSLGQAELKAAFTPLQVIEGGKRTKVKESRSNITHRMLLDLLKKSDKYKDIFPANTAIDDINTIPDGIYRVGISIKDDKDAKLIMEWPWTDTPDSKPADEVVVDKMPVPPIPKEEYEDPSVTTQYFWIAIDTHNPVIDIPNEQNVSGGIIMPETPVEVKGAVSDENGPITLVNWRVLNGGKPVSIGTAEKNFAAEKMDAGGKQVVGMVQDKDSTPKIDITPLVYNKYENGKWIYNFTYYLNMNGRLDGTYDFEFTFQDRFGNTSAKILRNSVDNGRPRVTLIKKIETFSRPFDDVILTGVQLATTPAAIKTNKERLAVKVVNFTINATDDNGVKGVRWWMLPANTGANETGYTSTGYLQSGAVNDKTGPTGATGGYNAFPANNAATQESVKDKDGKTITVDKPGVYYPSNISGFTKGAYGVVDVENRKFTIAFDSRKMGEINGEYRLHIIAEDNAGNYSLYSDSSIDVTNVFQEVFFLQEEDKPYFDQGITPGYLDPAVISGIWLGNGNFGNAGWPVNKDNTPYDPPVLNRAPIIRGTIWDNNGFFKADGKTMSWDNSIIIWFSGTGADLPSGWQTSVQNNSDIYNYKKEIVNMPSGNTDISLSPQGRNISLSIALRTLFPNEFSKDGRMRYIIKATDSPVNKLKEGEYKGGQGQGDYNQQDGNGIQRGQGSTSDDETVREYRYRQYAFNYDSIRPVVVIDTPVKKPVQTYGKNFAAEFILGGYISDANLETYNNPDNPNDPNNGKYFFDYYLNSDSKKTFILNRRDTVSTTTPSVIPPLSDNGIEGKHIYAITNINGITTVYFRIKASEVADNTKGIIPASQFNALPEGQHTLTLWATDKGGNEGVDWVDFIKDIEPPKIAFTNLDGDNRPYDANNKSMVDKSNGTPPGATSWWSKNRAVRESELLFGTSTKPPLPLSTISYERGSGIPELRGTITDIVSNIKLDVVNSSPASNTLIGHSGTAIAASKVGTGDINTVNSGFKYWIDNELTSKPEGRHLAIIDGAGTKSVRWTILLTADGTKDGTPLYDGVHTIVLKAEDVAGEPIQTTDQYMIAFRIDSKSPNSAAQASGASLNVVYGNVAYQNSTMFTLDIMGGDANLEKLELRIVNTTTSKEEPKISFTAKSHPASWTYYPCDLFRTATALSPAITIPTLLAGKFTPPTPPLTEDYVLFKGTYDVPKTLFTDSGKYDVIVAAYDTAGNKSEEYTFQFTYDKDQPEIEFTNPPDENKNAAGSAAILRPQDFIVIKADGTAEIKDEALTPNPTNKINRLTSQNLRIQGNVKDTFSAIRQVQSRLEKWNWLSATGGAWVELQTWTNIPNLDLANNTQTQIAWTKNLLGQDAGQTGSYDLRTLATGTDEDRLRSAEGLYRIQIRAKDASIIALGTDAVKQGWDFPQGQGNPIVSAYQYFYFDRTDPTLKITKINGGDTTMDTYYSNPGKFTFNGWVTDNNRFAKVEVIFESGSKTLSKDAVLTRLEATDEGYNATDPARTFNVGGVKQNWEAVFDDAGALPDGKYKVTVRVYDMTGRYSSETKSFILDSTKPTVKFTLPSKEAKEYKGFGDDSENPKPAAAGANGFASVYVLGGENAVITGVTDDKPNLADPSKNLPAGEAGSQSGVDQMWFHLGYIDSITDNTNYPFPTKQAIKDWEDTMITRYARNVGTVNVNLTVGAANSAWNGLASLTFKQRNKYMDLVAERRATGDNDTTGNAWFKLGGTEKPTGFVIDNPNIYDWRFEIPNNIPVSKANADLTAMGYTPVTINGVSCYQIGGLKLYGNTIRIKGRQYTVGSGARQMVRAVEGQTGVVGVYRLPLWVRVTDIAGNVEYYCHDIFIYPDGDIPITSIESPSNASKNDARGGTITVDGVARSNTSVYDVIFRVFADNDSTTDLDGTSKTVGTNPINLTAAQQRANLVIVAPTTSYPTVNDPGVLARIPDAYRNTDWQRASLTKTGGSGEPIIPWSIMLNSEDQIKNLIATKGFKSDNYATANDMIRVWLEVFVFNGEGSPIRSSIYAKDSSNTGNGALYGTANNTPPYYHTTAGPNPKPYVRAFYIKTGAAQITHPNVGTWTNNAFAWNTENPNSIGDAYYGYKGAGTETRRDQFAVKAILDPNPTNTSGSGLGEVAYRVRLDGGNWGTWTTAWTGKPNAQGNLEPALPANTGGVRITRRGTTPDLAGHGFRYDFVYAISSKATGNSTADWATINSGAWANTGGTVTVQIRMKDSNSPPNEAVQTIQVAVDNFTPLADKNYRTNPKVAGTNVNFVGRVYDYASPVPPLPLNDVPGRDSMNTEFTPRKLARVSVWFTKQVGTQTQFVNMNGNGAGKSETVATLPGTIGMRTINATTANSRDATISGGGADDPVGNITLTNRGTTANNMPYPNLGGRNVTTTNGEYASDYVRDITPASGQPANRMLWAPVSSQEYDVRWSLTLDSTLLPDGDLTLHYIVVDAAGNASYYTQTGISVRNNYPEISRVTLYTDNVGIGAVYTQPGEVSYAVNDYRAKMFANYTDLPDKPKSENTGYLNSGYISKNSYIGFRVETLRDTGNTPLKFRLQHVTRERVVLTRDNLQQLLRNRSNANNINLYTIAWHGNYTPQRWKAIGVSIEKISNPTLGTHFVLQAPDGYNTTTNTLPADFEDSDAEVWRYTQRAVMTADVTGAAGTNGTIVVGSAPTNFTAKPVFGFNGTDFNNILEYDGSHPDADDTKSDTPTSVSPASSGPVATTGPAGAAPNGTPFSPNGTAFFLIRVWDSVTGTNTNADDGLNDALVVGMNVYKKDSTRPSARLYDLNPYTETENVIDGNLNLTIKNAAEPPKNLGSNIVRGGLYNAGTNRAMTRSGFIDPRDQSKVLTPKNGLYDNEVTGSRQLINGVGLPAYPLRPVDKDGNILDSVSITGTTRDKVSGKIILRGLAWDDQLIYQIQIKIGSAAAFPIIQLNTTTAKLEPLTAYENSAFVYDELNWKTGHIAEWAYVWDTTAAPINNAPSNEVMIQVIVVDYKGNNGTPPGLSSPDLPATAPTAAVPTPTDTDTRFHNRVLVDVVPYITGFERATPTFTTKRSLQGWYSFYRGESNIAVLGYNFGSGTVTMNLGTTALTMTASTSPSRRVFSIPDSTLSGAITMTASGTAAYNNNSTTQGKSWNKEFNSFTPGSDLWINRHYAHIWRTAQAEGTGAQSEAGAGTIFAANNSSAGLDSPSMALQYTGSNVGLLHGSWTTYGRESLFYGQNKSAKPSVNNGNSNPESGFSGTVTYNEGTYNPSPSTALLLLKAGEPYSDSDIDYYNGANNDAYFSNTTIVASYQRDGEPYLVLKPRLTSVVFNNSNSTDGGGGDTGYYITRQINPVSTYRWKNTRIKKAAVSTANNNPGRVFISSYDSTYKRLFFKTVAGSVTTGGNSNVGGGGSGTDSDDNGGTAMYLDGGGTLTSGILTSGTLGTGAATGGAGNWMAVDYTSANYPVVAYFDEQNQTLRLAYASSTNPTAGSNWTRRYVLPDTGAGSELRRGSGSYVSMKIDRENGNRVHLAFYNSTNKAVVYATAPSPSGTFTATVIDRVVEGGQWTDISVDSSGNPWIVYADSSRIGGRDGARIAYRSYSGTGTAPAGAFGRELKDPVSGNMITGWEAMTMPANYLVNNDRLNIAAWPPTGYSGTETTAPIGKWNAAVGYASDQFRVGYFFKPNVTMGNN